jgi:hypothetical protein
MSRISRMTLVPVQGDFVARDRKWQGPDPDATVFREDLAGPTRHDGQIVGRRYDFADAKKLGRRIPMLRRIFLNWRALSKDS